MTTNEFYTKLNASFEKHPMIAKSKAKTINELLYVLRMEFDDDIGVSICDKKGQ